MSIFDVFTQLEQKEQQKSLKPITWIVVGLGNPGEKYQSTRHNAGFMACDELAKSLSCTVNKLKFKGLFGETAIGDERVLLVKPQTFMNLSGDCVATVATFYKIPADHVLVFSDDLSLPIGTLRVRSKGSHGGHNGLKDIALKLGTDMFPRIKLGVGAPPHPDFPVADWVLSKFSENENKEISRVAKNAAEACKTFITLGIEQAMQQFNGSK